MNAAYEDAVTQKIKESDETKHLMLDNVGPSQNAIERTAYEETPVTENENLAERSKEL